jgi:hypothetical protein
MTITAPAVGAQLATDQIAGIHFPLGKLVYGEEDAATLVSPEHPFPVSDAPVLAILTALVAALAPVAGGATEVTLAGLLAKFPASLGAKAASGSLSIVPATGADLATGALQTTANTTLAQIVTLLTSEGGYLDGVEALLGTGNGSLGQIVTALAATLKVQTPIPAGVVAGQVALVAGVRQQLPSNALVNGVVVKAAATNTGPILIGGSTVSAATDGTGGGYPIAPGEAMSFAVANTSALYLMSTPAGVAYFGGN